MKQVTTVQDLLSELEGKMDNEIFVVVRGELRELRIQEVYSAGCSLVKPRTIFLCEENRD